MINSDKIQLENSAEKLGRIISSNYGITVNISSESSVPTFDFNTNTVTLPILPYDFSGDDLTLFRAYLDHEACGHAQHTTGRNRSNGLLGHIENALEDGRVDKLVGEKFFGAKYNLSFAHNHNIKLIADMLVENDISQDEIKITGLLDKLYLKTVGWEDLIHTNINSELFDKLTPELLEKFNNLKNTQGVFDLAKEIHELLFNNEEGQDESPESKGNKNSENKKKEKNEKKEVSPDSTQNKDKEDSSRGQDDKSQRDKQEQQEKKGEEGDNKVGETKVNDTSETLADKVEENEKLSQAITELQNKVIQKSFENIVKGGTKKSGGYRPFTLNDVELFVKDVGYGSNGSGGKQVTAKVWNDTKNNVMPLAQKFMMDLVTQTRRWRSNQQSGILDDKKLYKIPAATMKDTPTIFRNRVKSDGIDTVFSVLMDMSGSMGKDVFIALALCRLISNSLSIIKVPNEVLGFTASTYCGVKHTIPTGDKNYDRVTPLNHVILKSFDQVLESVVSEWGKVSTIMNCNVDGEAVMWAANRLAYRQEKRKILLVLSDGLPNDNYRADTKLRKHLKTVTRKLNLVGINTIGIGIYTDEVRHYYDQYIVYSNIKELFTDFYPKLINIIKTGKLEILC